MKGRKKKGGDRKKVMEECVLWDNSANLYVTHKLFKYKKRNKRQPVLSHHFKGDSVSAIQNWNFMTLYILLVIKPVVTFCQIKKKYTPQNPNATISKHYSQKCACSKPDCSWYHWQKERMTFSVFRPPPGGYPTQHM